MSSTEKTPKTEQPILGMVYMIIAMFLLPIMDGLAKFLGTDLASAEISFWRFTVQGLLLILPIWTLKIWYFQRKNIFWQVIPGIFIATATVFFFHGLQYMSMAKTITIFFVSPLLLTILSVIFLRETLRIRRVSCLIVGFIGVMIVMRPNNFEFEWFTLLPLSAALFFSFYMLSLRRIAKLCHPFMNQWYIALGAIAYLGVLLIMQEFGLDMLNMHFHGPKLQHLPYLLGLGIIAVTAHSLILSASAKAPANLLAPLGYAELLGATIIGYFAFNEIPDKNTLIGGSLIVLSGLYLIYREQQLRKQGRTIVSTK